MNNNNTICCDTFRKMLSAFQWFTYTEEDSDTMLMPCIEVNGMKWRVNHCPSCGKEVRNVLISKDEYRESTLNVLMEKEKLNNAKM